MTKSKDSRPATTIITEDSIIESLETTSPSKAQTRYQFYTPEIPKDYLKTPDTDSQKIAASYSSNRSNSSRQASEELQPATITPSASSSTAPTDERQDEVRSTTPPIAEANTTEIAAQPAVQESKRRGLNFFGKKRKTIETVAPAQVAGDDASTNSRNAGPEAASSTSTLPAGNLPQTETAATTPEANTTEITAQPAVQESKRRGLNFFGRKRKTTETVAPAQVAGGDASTNSRNAGGDDASIASTPSDENITVNPTATIEPAGPRGLFGRRNRQTATPESVQDIAARLEALQQSNDGEVSVAASNRSATGSAVTPPAATTEAGAEAAAPAADNRSRYQKAVDWSQDLSGVGRFRKPGSAESGIGNGALLKTLPQTAVNLFDATLRGTTAVAATALAIPAAILLDAPAAIQKRIADRQERARGGNPEETQDRYISSGLVGTARNQGGKALKSTAYAVGTGVTAAVGPALATGIGAGAVGAGVGIAAGVAGTAVGIGASVAAAGTAVGVASVPLSGAVGGIAGGASGLVKGGLYEGAKGAVKGAAEGVEEATRAIRGNRPLYERKDEIRSGDPALARGTSTEGTEDRGTLEKIAKSPLSAVPALGSAIANSFANSWKAIVKGPINAIKGALKNETTNGKLSRRVDQLSEQNNALRGEIEELRTFQNAGRRVGTLTTAINAFQEAGRSDNISLGSGSNVGDPSDLRPTPSAIIQTPEQVTAALLTPPQARSASALPTQVRDNTAAGRASRSASSEGNNSLNLNQLDSALPKVPTDRPGLGQESNNDGPPLVIGVPRSFRVQNPEETYAATLERQRSQSPQGRPSLAS